jgi:hypothetical protein
MNNIKFQHYCFDCGIPVFDLLKRNLDSSTLVYVCINCAEHRGSFNINYMNYVRKEGVLVITPSPLEKPHEPRWNYPNAKSHHNSPKQDDLLSWMSELIQWQDHVSKADKLDIARRMFPIEPMPQGAKSTYDRDIDVATIVKKQSLPVRKSLDYHNIPRRKVADNTTYDHDIDMSAILEGDTF